MKKTKLFIMVESGVVSGVESNNPEEFDGIEIYIVDKDIEGSDPDQIDTIIYNDDLVEEAATQELAVEQSDIKSIKTGDN